MTVRPRRIQRRRERGWRQPQNAIYVGRPSKWGNPFDNPRMSTEERVRRYRQALLSGQLDVTVEEVRRELRGRDLACWCPLDRPCHADVLLEVAGTEDGA